MNRKSYWLRQSMLALALMFIYTTAFAQMEGDRSGKKEMMGGGMSGMPMMREMMRMHDMAGMMEMMQAISRLDLTPDQKKEIESLKLKHHKEAIPLLARVSMAEVELKELLMGDSVDPEKVKGKVQEKHIAVAELEASHLLLTQQVKAALPPEQRRKMESMMMETGPMMGGMGPSAGKDRPEKGSKAGPKDSEGGAPKTGDEHGH